MIGNPSCLLFICNYVAVHAGSRLMQVSQRQWRSLIKVLKRFDSLCFYAIYVQRQEAASATECKQLQALEILTRIHGSQTPGLQGWGLLPMVVAKRSKGIMFQWSWANHGNLIFIGLFMVPERRCTPSLMTRLLHDNNIICYRLPFVTLKAPKTCTTDSSLP